MMAIYSTCLVLVLVVGAPFWVFRMLTSGRYRAGLPGRLGAVPGSLRERVAGREVIWVHAVSVGEALVAAPLVREIETAHPEWVVAISTTTQTAQELARKRFPESPVFYIPLDFGFLMRRYLRVLRPRLVILMESELWPNMIRECGRMGVPMAVANARISDRSFPRSMRLRRLWRPVMERVTMFLAQGEETAGRLREIGVSPGKIRVTGNLKYDIRTASKGSMAEALRSRVEQGRPIVVCGSTLEGEERMLLAAWREVLKAEPEAVQVAVLVIAPRHPQRFDAVAQTVAESGYELMRATAMGDHTGEIPAGTVVVLDTIGDLAGVYSLATVAFVGGSLVPSGGHNPLEPAQFAVPVLMGESVFNFREVVEAMRDGIRIVEGDGLAAAMIDLLVNPAEARELGRRGQEVFEQETGATARTMAAIEEILGVRRGAPR